MGYFTQFIPETLPTYGEKYRMGGGDLYGNECYARILMRDYTGSVTTLNGAGFDPIEVSFNFSDLDYFKPMAGSSCTLQILTNRLRDLVEFFKADETQYRVEVYDSVKEEGVVQSRLIFSGFIRPETYNQQYGTHQSQVQITATDGLGLLKFMKFKPIETPLIGTFALSDVLSYLLYLAGNRNDWYDMVPYTVPGTSMRFTNNCFISLFDFFEQDCYSVLMAILSTFKMQVCLSGENFIVRLVDDQNTVLKDRFDYRGQLIDSSEHPSVTKNLYNIMTGVSGSIQLEKPIKSVIFDTSAQARGNLLYNGDFKEGAVGWEPSPDLLPDHWKIEKEVLYIYEYETPSPPGEGEEEEKTSSSIPYVSNNFGRGLLGAYQLITLQVTGEVKLSPWTGLVIGEELEWFVKVGLQGTLTQIEEAHNKGPDWQSFTLQFQVSPELATGAINLQLYGSARVGPSALVWPAVLYRNLQVIPLIYNSDLADWEPVRKKKITEEVILQSENLEERDVTLDYITQTFSGGQSGVWFQYSNIIGLRNSIPYIVQEFYGIQKFFEQTLKDRFIQYFENGRIRITFTGLKNEDFMLTPNVVISDQFMRRVFTILQYSYRVISKSISIQCLEYGGLELIPVPDEPPDEDDDWILATGFWRDIGVWRDNKYWIDEL